ncbi:unnamed protein product [Phytophthora fragariaefolia]|uniref:Unnamed protein product n=1 Tax=Phytophthora fragariaefolia TaxID=1490495 RepID=A0A9W6YMV4_9STRA|nr:unnamed protein product [Phytophthora fragariaefolia]
MKTTLTIMKKRAAIKTTMRLKMDVDKSEDEGVSSSEDEEDEGITGDDTFGGAPKVHRKVNRKFEQRTKLSVPVFFVGFPSTFDSWDAFHASFDHFQRESFQQFSKRTSTSVTVRNIQIEQSAEALKKGGKRPRKAKTLVPTKWGFYSKTLKCTHAQKHQPRGAGKRKHSKVRGTKCTATVNARVAATSSGTWELRVSASGNHDHDLNEHLWENYAENRTITDPHLKSDVAVLHKAGASARGILQYLRERTGQQDNIRCIVVDLMFSV